MRLVGRVGADLGQHLGVDPAGIARPVWRVRPRECVYHGKAVAVQTLEEIRAVFDPIETDLWEEAAEVPDDVSSQQTFVEEAWKRVEAALEVLVRAGAAT